jgi:hypothetical protein
MWQRAQANVNRCQPRVCSRCVSGVCELLAVGAALVSARPVARVDSSGKPACELCGRRLADVKHVHRHGPGHACHPRCKGAQQQSASGAAAAPPKPARKRRAESDPGEERAPPALTRRVKAPAPAAAIKKQRTRREERIMRQLDETVARREAWEAAQAAATH